MNWIAWFDEFDLSFVNWYIFREAFNNGFTRSFKLKGNTVELQFKIFKIILNCTILLDGAREKDLSSNFSPVANHFYVYWLRFFRLVTIDIALFISEWSIS